MLQLQAQHCTELCTELGRALTLAEALSLAEAPSLTEAQSLAGALSLEKALSFAQSSQHNLAHGAYDKYCVLNVSLQRCS